MASLEYLVIFILFLIFLPLSVFLYKPHILKALIRRNWPVLGITPAVLATTHRFHDFVTDILTYNGGTFKVKGPWLAKIDMLITADPSDVHHVLSKNFPNYPKGHNFRKMFDILGDGIFNADGHLWEILRKTTISVFKHPDFQSFFEETIWNKVESGLLPVLEAFSKQGKEIDFQEVFQRFTFDTTSKLLLDNDLQSLSLPFRCIPCEKAMSDIEEALFYRHFTPPTIWKLQQLLSMGNEKKLSDAWKLSDRFVYECLARKGSESDNMQSQHEKENFWLITSLMREFEDQSGTSGDPNKFLRDTIVSLMAAGRDTTSVALSWFFYLVAKNPIVEDNIRQEIHTRLDPKAGDRKWNAKELSKLVYLHAAIHEALRLFPPVPFNHKTPLQPEILPSGHHVDQNTMIILSFYSMGRMKKIWGNDCKEFKPERWVSKDGGIKHEPSYKFTAFNAGPRTSLGKDMSLTQLKIVAATIIRHYHVELVEGQRVFPCNSIVLQMKHGLKVRLTKQLK